MTKNKRRFFVTSLACVLFSGCQRNIQILESTDKSSLLCQGRFVGSLDLIPNVGYRMYGWTVVSHSKSKKWDERPSARVVFDIKKATGVITKKDIYPYGFVAESIHVKSQQGEEMDGLVQVKWWLESSPKEEVKSGTRSDLMMVSICNQKIITFGSNEIATPIERCGEIAVPIGGGVGSGAE